MNAPLKKSRSPFVGFSLLFTLFMKRVILESQVVLLTQVRPSGFFSPLGSYSREFTFLLRVLPTIFDPTLKTHFFLTDGARPNSFFLLKQLTQKLYADSISADSTLTSGSSEQLKIKTSNAIGFRYRRAEGS